MNDTRHVASGMALLGLLMAGQIASADAGPRPMRELTVSAGALQMNYVEKDEQHLTPEGFLDAENGPLTAVRVHTRIRDLSTRLNRPYEVTASLMFASGSTTYDGHLQPPSLAYLRTTDSQRISDVDLRLGFPLSASDHRELTPVVFLGRHDWNRSSASFAEWYSHFLAGGGLEAGQEWNEQWWLRGEVTAAWMLDSTLDVTSHHTVLDLGPSVILGAAIEAEYRWDAQTGVFGRVGWQRFEYGRSGTVNGIYEPASVSQLSPFLFGLRRSF